jgi:hypothetical protein
MLMLGYAASKGFTARAISLQAESALARNFRLRQH